MVIDFRELKKYTIDDAYPLLRTNHQVLTSKEDRGKTAFSTPLAHVRIKRMSFGLKEEPATFQRLMDETLHEFLEKNDFFIPMTSLSTIIIPEHIEKLQSTFERLSTTKLKLQPQKCHFLKREKIHLGHKCRAEGHEPDPEKTSAIQGIKEPIKIKEIQSFLGIVNYYRRFTPNFAKI